MVKAVEVMKAAVPRMSSTNWAGRKKPRTFVKEFFPDLVHLSDPSGGALCRPGPAKKPAKAAPPKAAPVKAAPVKAAPAKAAPPKAAPVKAAQASQVPKQKPAPVADQPSPRYLTAAEIDVIRAELLRAVARKNPFPLSGLHDLVRKSVPWIVKSDWAGYKRPGRFMEHVYPEFRWVSGPAGGGYRPPQGWSPPPRPRPAPSDPDPTPPPSGTTRFGESMRRFTSQIRRILE
jgi:hypothetical protein